jgi:[histone H3]-lysine9 N-trimethyltransferase SUV39H
LFSDRQPAEISKTANITNESKKTATGTSTISHSSSQFQSNQVKSEVKLVSSESPGLGKTTSERHVTKQAESNYDVFKEGSESKLIFVKPRASVAYPESAKKQHIHPEKQNSSRSAPKQTNGTTKSLALYSESNANSSFLENAEHEYSARGKTLRTVSPDAKSRMRSTTTPSRPIVVVEINNSPHKSATELQSASHLLLEKFRKPLPTSKSGTYRTRSLAIRETSHSRGGPVLRERRKDASMVQSRASTSEGLSEQHESESDDVPTVDQRKSEPKSERKSVAQPKAKKVQRSKIKLDMGASTLEPSKPFTFAFNAADVVAPAKQVKRLLDAKFSDLTSGAPLTFVNEKNDRHIDGKFQFVNSYIHRGNRKAPLAPSESGCKCSRCDANGTTCSCLQMQDKDKPAPYIRSQNGVTILNPKFIDTAVLSPQEIFECNDSCKCSKNCFNRVVQRGRTIPLQIFMTERCGFGIRSPLPIKKGQFIDVYLGELLTTKELEEYEAAINEKTPSFVFSLDFFPGTTTTYHIQGLHFGSPTRFINHSCNPNSRTFMVMMNHADKKLYKLAYFAIKDIPAMKEITFDYCPVLSEETSWAPTGDKKDDEHVVQCFCGERNCRGRVWPDRGKSKRKGRGRAKF